MADVATEKSWDTTTVRNSLKFCLKIAWFINDTLNHNNGALLIVGDHDATHKTTVTNVSLTTGMSGRCNARVNSRNSSSIIYPPVLKFEDGDPGSSNKPRQDDNNDNIINGSNNGNDDVHFKIPNNQNIINGGNENGGNNNDNNRIRDGNPNNNNRVGSRIQVMEVYDNGIIKRPKIHTNINPIYI